MMKNRFIHEIKNECKNTTFIILCANKSNKKGTNNIPLFTVDGVTLIDRQIGTINSLYLDNEIIIVSGFEHDKLVKHIHKSKYKNVRIIENSNYKNSTALDGWRIGLNLCIKSNVYIIHGDRLFTKESIMHNNQKTHLIINDEDRHNYNLGILSSKGTLINMSYGLPDVWSEIFFIDSSNFDISRKLINNCKQYKIYNIEGYINTLSKKIRISTIKKTDSIKNLKDIK